MSDTPASNPAQAPGADVFDSNETIEKFASFDDMPLSRELTKGIYSFGFQYPSPIQQRAIVPMSKGGDLIAQAPSGTGKTGAFAIGLLSRIDPSLRVNQALVLCPAQDLAIQALDTINAIGRFLPCAQPIACSSIGNTDVRENMRTIQSGIPVIVGTPGRTNDMITRGALVCKSLKVLVLDEADQMLNQGFLEQISEMLRYLPKEMQVCLFSATFPQHVRDLANQVMTDPTRIFVEAERLPLEAIRQFYIHIHEEYKLATVLDLYKSCSISQSIIFCNGRGKVRWLAEQMEQAGYKVMQLHSELPKDERTGLVKRFREGAARVLISTDVAARGIDIQQLSVVINFDFTRDTEQYLHRIGRCGRYGRKGIAISLITDNDRNDLQRMQDHYKVKITELPKDFQKYIDHQE